MRNFDMALKVGPLRRVRGAAHIAFLLGIFAALVPAPLFAASTVTLAWDPSTSTNIAGYKVYYGPARPSGRQKIVDYQYAVALFYRILVHL